MKIGARHFKFVLMGVACWILCAVSASGVCHNKEKWCYRGCSAVPRKWVKNYPDCSATRHQQSPINIPASVVKRCDGASFDITHNYYAKPSRGHTYVVENNGRTVEMHFGETGYRLYVEKVAYKPVQAHIHYRVRKGSEDAIDGKKFPGEVHLVHQRVDGSENLVIAVFVKYSLSTPSLGLQKLLSNIQHIKNPYTEENNQIPAFPLGEFLPYGDNGMNMKPFHGYNTLHYTGSLTTPGCNGGVKWYLIVNRALKFKLNHMRVLNRIRDCYGKRLAGNHRPIQPILPETRIFGSRKELN